MGVSQGFLSEILIMTTMGIFFPVNRAGTETGEGRWDGDGGQVGITRTRGQVEISVY